MATLLSLAAAQTDGVVSFSFERKRTSDSEKAAYDGTVSSDITNDVYLYMIDILLGSPTQKVSLQLDTGSSDLWVMGAGNPYCIQTGIDDGTYNSTNEFDCLVRGIYNPTDSTTWKEIYTDFSLQYGG